MNTYNDLTQPTAFLTLDEWKNEALQRRQQVVQLENELSAVRICFAEASHSAGPTTVHVEMLKKDLDDLRQKLAQAERDLQLPAEVVKRIRGAAMTRGWVPTPNWQDAIDHLTNREIEAEGVLRRLASYLGAGGFNAPFVNPQVFYAKIRDGIELLTQPLQERIADLATRLAQAERELEGAKNPTPDEIASLRTRIMQDYETNSLYVVSGKLLETLFEAESERDARILRAERERDEAKARADQRPDHRALKRLDEENTALTAERDAAVARAEKAEKSLVTFGPCITLARHLAEVAKVKSDLAAAQAQAAGMRGALEQVYATGSNRWEMSEVAANSLMGLSWPHLQGKPPADALTAVKLEEFLKGVSCRHGFPLTDEETTFFRECFERGTRRALTGEDASND